MSIETIVKELDLEIARLESVKSLLTITETTKRRAGRPAKASNGISMIAPAKVRRQLSPEARKRIADAQKARWKKYKAGKAA